MILLDTNIWLWLLIDDLSSHPALAEELANPEIFVAVSVASFWEVAIKAGKGKLQIPDNLVELTEQLNLFTLDIDPEDALSTRNLESIHSDPFDRMIVTQAGRRNLQLLTSDRTITQYESYADIRLIKR